MSNRRCIFFQYSTPLGHLIGPLVKALKRLHDIDTVLVVRSEYAMPPDLAAFELEASNFLKVVVTEPHLALRPADELPSRGELAERAVELETRHNVSFLEILRTDRHLAMGFVPNILFPRSNYGKDATYDQSIDLVSRLVELHGGLLDKYKPIAVLGLPTNVDTAPLADVAAGRDIPLRFPVKARWTGDNFHWASDRYGTWWDFLNCYERTVAATPATTGAESEQAAPTQTTAKLDTPYRMKVAMQASSMRTGIVPLLKTLVIMTAREARKRLRGRREVYGRYLLPDNLVLSYRQWRFGRRILREKPAMESIDPTTPFVFFPLQTEPETNLMCEVPDFDNQLTAIDLLAKTMPAGWYLVVKEHPAQTGARPQRFWDIVNRYPNIIVAATLESGEEIAERAQAIAMINASLGMQGAVAGKPVLSFHSHFNGAVMPHVFPVNSYADLRKTLSRIAAGRIPPLEERLRAGRAFVQAMEENSFLIDDPHMRAGVCGPAPVAVHVAEAVANNLVASLGEERAGEARAKRLAHVAR